MSALDYIRLFHCWLRLQFSRQSAPLECDRSCREALFGDIGKQVLGWRLFKIRGMGFVRCLCGHRQPPSTSSQNEVGRPIDTCCIHVIHSAFVYAAPHRNLISFAFRVMNYVYRNVWRECIIRLFSIRYRKGEKLTSSPFRHNNMHLEAHNRIQTNIVFSEGFCKSELKRGAGEIQRESLNVICNAFETTTKVGGKTGDII